MPECFYCHNNYEFPKGLTLVAVDGTVKHLCSSKCRKNMKMKRRKVHWVMSEKKTKLKEKGRAEIAENTKKKAVRKSSGKSKEKVEKPVEKPANSKN
jgi:ribosomal protein L24E